MANSAHVEEGTMLSGTIPVVHQEKYLTFELGDESYGVAVLKVREIIRMQEVTPVPKMPAHVKGVINLRGKIIPVVDLRIKFGLRNLETTEQTCIVVVQATNSGGDSSQIGIIVDAVQEVVAISSEEMEESPDFGGKVNTDYILSMAKVKGDVKTLLDIDKVLDTGAIQEISLGLD